MADLSPIMSLDTVSSLFPDRPIRPLPKRRLRERLSPEVADSIRYPPSAHDNTPLFYYPPYTVKEEASPPRVTSSSPGEQPRPNDPPRNYTPRRSGAGLADGYDDDAALRSTLVTRSPPEILNRTPRRPSKPEQSLHPNPQPPPSAASSIDGYDFFENTNNKKKRKIPSAGDVVINGTHALNNEINTLAISSGAQSPASELNGDKPYSPTPGYPATGTFMTNSQGISGPGRGRLGRSRNARSPLRALPDGNSSWSGRASKTTPQWASSEPEGSGIISNAIANAEKLRPQGQENVSLLQQHSAAKQAPASTQFTFTCDSQVPGTVQWPGHSTKNSITTQTSGMSSGVNGNSGHYDESPKRTSGRSGYSRRRERRRLDKDLAKAARNRRQVAANNYYHNPPKLEDIWICEFCEYERIFGEPPRALIRDYEIKDRRHRKEEADRKRLLEKAKAKSRKGRKTGKAAAKGSHVPQSPVHDQIDSIGDHDAPPLDSHGHSTQSEEDYGYDYEDEYSNPPIDIPPDIDDSGGGYHRPPNLKY